MTGVPAGGGPRDGGRRGRSAALPLAISAEIVALYERVYGHDRTTAKTYINDNVVLCVLENILTEREALLVDAGEACEVVDERVAFQTGAEDEFTAAVERLTHRRVVAFMSANQTQPGVAAELFLLDGAARPREGRRGVSPPNSAPADRLRAARVIRLAFYGEPARGQIAEHLGLSGRHGQGRIRMAWSGCGGDGSVALTGPRTPADGDPGPSRSARAPSAPTARRRRARWRTRPADRVSRRPPRPAAPAKAMLRLPSPAWSCQRAEGWGPCGSEGLRAPAPGSTEP